MREEWVVRDEFAVLQDLKMDPYEVAADLARRSPVLGKVMVSDDTALPFAGTVEDVLSEGVCSPRPDLARAECETVLTMFDRDWNRKFFDEVPRYCADNIVCQTMQFRCAMRTNPLQIETIGLLSMIPDGKV